MSWFMGVEEARQHIDRARRQLETVQRALSSEPQNPEIAVTWAFYAYEKCIVALAERYGYRWTKNHGQKADLARKLHADGRISRDIGDELEELNSLRKDVAYDEPGSDLSARNLEDLAYELEEFIEEVDSRIGSSR